LLLCVGARTLERCCTSLLCGDLVADRVRPARRLVLAGEERLAKRQLVVRERWAELRSQLG